MPQLQAARLMHVALVPVAVAGVALAVLALVVRTQAWRRQDDLDWKSTSGPTSPLMQRMTTRKGYRFLASSAFCVLAATVSGEHIGYLIGGMCAAMGLFSLYYARARS